MLPKSSSHGKSRPRIIKIHLFRNGNSNFKGVIMRFESKKYTSFIPFLEDVTDLLSKNVFLNRGGVKSLYDVNGTKITSILDIEDNGMYVATCLQETFKDAIYNYKGVLPSQPVHNPPLTARASIYSSGSTRSLLKIGTASELGQAKKITIVRAGNRPRKISRVLLNSRNAPDFERAMTVINEATKFDSAPVHSIYTLGGNLVSSLDDIFGRHFIFFSFRKETVCSEKDLQLTEKEVELVIQLNTSSKDKVTLKKPPRLEPPMTKVLPQITMKYDMTKRIGKGIFSSIYHCSVKMPSDDGVRYAMKISRKNKDTYESLSQELQMLRAIRHPNIVRLVTYVDAPSEVYFMFEMLDADLHAVMMREGKIAESEAKLFMENILSALFYLHCLKIVHRNVSVSNLMVTPSPSGKRTMKLIDFGLACRSFKPLFEICGEEIFMAPEMVKNEGYGEKVDVWAAGVVLYYMIASTYPFLGLDKEEDKRVIVEEEYDNSSGLWKNISGGAKHFIDRMLCKSADYRYNADSLLSHGWITGSSTEKFYDYKRIRSNSSGDTSRSSASDAESVVIMSPRTKTRVQSGKERGDGEKLEEEEDSECEDEGVEDFYCEDDEDLDLGHGDASDWNDF